MSVSEPTDEASGAAALQAFLAFRNADMDLWRRASTHLGLSIQATRVLARIIRSSEMAVPLRQVDLKHSMQMSAAGLSQVIDVLEERRLVRRVPHTTDRRAYGLEPGEAAEPIARVFDEYFAAFDRLAAGLTPEERAAVTTVMRGMEAASAMPFAEPPSSL